MDANSVDEERMAPSLEGGVQADDRGTAEVMSNTDRVLQWLAFYYSSANEVYPSWVTFDAGGGIKRRLNVGDYLLALFIPVGFVVGKILRKVFFGV